MPTYAQAAAGNCCSALAAIGAAVAVAALTNIVWLAILMVALAAGNLALAGLWLWLEKR